LSVKLHFAPPLSGYRLEVGQRASGPSLPIEPIRAEFNIKGDDVTRLTVTRAVAVHSRSISLPTKVLFNGTNASTFSNRIKVTPLHAFALASERTFHPPSTPVLQVCNNNCYPWIRWHSRIVRRYIISSRLEKAGCVSTTTNNHNGRSFQPVPPPPAYSVNQRIVSLHAPARAP
jgi:hypothetical protein